MLDVDALTPPALFTTHSRDICRPQRHRL